MSRFVPCSIRHIDLAAPRESWQVEDAGGGVLLVFWLDDVPLGSRWLDANELPLGASQVVTLASHATLEGVGFWSLGDVFAPNYHASESFNARKRGSTTRESLASLRDPLATLRDRLRMQPLLDHEDTSLSVVICTRDRAESLGKTLESLMRSAELPHEIVVVDNAPRDTRTRDVVSRFERARYVVEMVPGLSQARNAGLRASHGAFVAYTDDDVEVHPHWTARVRRALATGEHAAMTGLVLPASLALESEYLFEKKFGGFAQGFRRMIYDAEWVEDTKAWGVPVWRIGAGANMAFRRDALRKVGGFDERLGAGRAGCSEDSELWYRLLRSGDSCVYEPRAVTFHHHRGDLGALRRQMRAYARGHMAALFAQFERTGDWGNIKRAAISIPKYYLGRIVGRLTTIAVPTRSTYFDEVAGSVAGVAYWLRHRRSPGAPSQTGPGEP